MVLSLLLAMAMAISETYAATSWQKMWQWLDFN
jgi:hypothetical protein